MPRAGLDERRVVAAAAELADDVGATNVTLRSLAARLGVQPPSLYEHVRGIDELRGALAVKAHRDLAAALRGATVGRAGGEALIALAHAYRGFARRHPGLYAASLRAPGPTETELRAAVRDVVEVMVLALRAYELEDQEVLHAVRCLRAAVHGFIALEEMHGFGALDTETTFAMLTQLHLDGLEARRFAPTGAVTQEDAGRG